MGAAITYARNSAPVPCRRKPLPPLAWPPRSPGRGPAIKDYSALGARGAVLGGSTSAIATWLPALRHAGTSNSGGNDGLGTRAQAQEGNADVEVGGPTAGDRQS